MEKKNISTLKISLRKGKTEKKDKKETKIPKQGFRFRILVPQL